MANGHASNEETWLGRDHGERGQWLLRPRVLPCPQIVAARFRLVHLCLTLTCLIKTSSVSRRQAVALIGDGAEWALSPGGRDLGNFEAVADRHSHFVPALIGEDIVSNRLSDRATSGDSRREQAVSHDDRPRALIDGDAQWSTLQLFSKRDKTVFRVGADEERQTTKLLRPKGGRPLLS